MHRDATDGPVRKLPPLHLYWRPTSWALLAEGLHNGLLTIPAVRRHPTFTDGDVLPVPGKPRVLHLPGHTAGNCAVVLDAAGVVFSGDGLVSLDPYTPVRGPRLLLDVVNERPIRRAPH